MLATVELNPQDLPGTAQRVLDAWRKSLVVTIKGPREPFDVRGVYHELLPMIGTPHYLAEDSRVGDRSSQRTGELWTEVRYDPAIPNAYRHSSNAQPLHTDGSYVETYPNATLMCCVANAAEGGETVFISGDALISVLGEEDPKLLEQLQTTPMRHARSGDSRTYSVIRSQAGRPFLNWNYYCVAPDAPADVQALREAFFKRLRESSRIQQALTSVKLGAGDAVVWKDEEVLHGRNGFVASAVGERFLWKAAVDVDVFS